jgi:hypothetical protein
MSSAVITVGRSSHLFDLPMSLLAIWSHYDQTQTNLRSPEWRRWTGNSTRRCTIDGQAFRSTFMAMGDGTHKLPVKAEVRKLIEKGEGDSVVVRLTERLN